MRSLILVLTFVSFSWSFASPLPDLTDLPENLDLAPPKPKEVKVSKHELEQQTLTSLKTKIKEMDALGEAKQLRLLSLIEELQGKPDQAYLTLKKAPTEDHDLWYAFRELYLSDLLGLEEDTHKLAHLINERLQLKRLKVLKVEFCRSVKRYGIYESIQGPLNLNQTTILYVEINHLEQQLIAGQYKSSCRASFDIRDENGLSVYHFNYPNPFTYESKSQLNDYYIWMNWTPNLGPGKYTMHLKIEDERSRIHSIKEHEFEIK